MQTSLRFGTVALVARPGIVKVLRSTVKEDLVYWFVYFWFYDLQLGPLDEKVERLFEWFCSFGYGSKKGTPKTLLVKGKKDQNLWSLRVFFLTQSHFSVLEVVAVSGVSKAFWMLLKA